MPPPVLPLCCATSQTGSITLLFLLMFLSHSLLRPLNKKRPINHLAVSVGLGYWCWSELSHYPSWVDMTLKAPKKKKKKPFPTPLTLKNQHGENYILVEESNKSWPNVAGEVEKGPPWRLQPQWCGSRAGGKGKPHKRRFVLARGRWGARGVSGRIRGLKSACGL